MNMIAATYHLETPSTLLRRVEQLENETLPSLPSCTMEYDSEIDTSGEDLSLDVMRKQGDEEDPSTPHPLINAVGPPSSSTLTQTSRSSADGSSTTVDSPFPPSPSSSAKNTPSPYASSAIAAMTSTPFSLKSRSRSRSTLTGMSETQNTFRRQERTLSATGRLESSSLTGKERWQTPGEMSRSFSGDEIPVEDELQEESVTEDLGAEESVPLNDLSLSNEPFETEAAAQTPFSHRLSSGNVLLQRPGKRSQSFLPPQPEEDSQSASPTGTTETTKSPTSTQTALLVPPQGRIPSLSKSELSGTDTSGAASTPEGPTRSIVIARPGDDLEEEDDGGQDQRWSEPMQSDENATFDYRQNSAHDPGEHALAVSVAGRYDTPAKSETSSPMKVVSTPYSSTPGLSRRIQMDRYTSMRSSTPQQSSALRDITTTRQGTQAETPFTPSPLKMDSTAGDFATPRPLLDDAERRKSHVLAVLNSTSVPSRNMRPAPKGTPHPLRRVSLAATSESVTERGSPMASNLTSTMTPGSRTRHSIDATQTQSANESFVSIASSADLTSDRRATKIASRLSRGNTSFPTILLPTNAAMPSPGGSLKGLSDHRADGVKIHKHLNAMNKQLLETNADLAREAEAWRDEVERLKELLKDHGVQVEEVDIEALVQAGGESLATTGERWQKDSPSDSGGFSRHHDRQFGSPDLLRSQLSASKAHLPTHASSQDPLEGLNPHEHAAVMLEMAERLEALEEGLDDKDRMITELQQELGAAKSSGAAEPQDHIDELHRQLEEGERMRVALHSEFVLKTEQHAKRFGEICSGFEEQVKSLEAQLAVAKSETERLRAEKSRIEAFTCKDGLNDREKEWRKQLSGLELDLSRTKEEARAHAGEVESLRKHSKLLEAERSELARMAEAAHIRVIELEARVAGAELGSEDARALRTEIDEARAGRLAASDDMAQVEHTIKDLHKINSDQEAELERQYEQIEKLSQRVLGLELALDAAAGDRRQADGELMAEVNRLREALQDAEDDLADKEAELAVAHRKIATQDVQAILDHTAPPPSPDEGERRDQEQRGLMQALEQQLDNAFREIGRLKHEISTTPHRVSSIEMRDARIKALEREKAALTERLASVRSTSASPPLHGGMQTAGSPFNRPTPFAHKAIASLRTPKTPGPLKDLSWLQTTIGDANEPILRAQLDQLQEELEDANGQLDTNFTRLEAAGLSGIALAEKLAAAEDRISELEDEIRALMQRNQASLALVTHQRAEQGRDSDSRMKTALASVQIQMDILKSDMNAERDRLHEDNGRLKDLNSELRLRGRAEVDSFRKEIERLAEGMKAELEAAEEAHAVALRERDSLQRDLEASAARIRRVELDLSDRVNAFDDLTRRHARQAQANASSAELAQSSETNRTLQAALSEANSIVERAEAQVSALQEERASVAHELLAFEADLKSQRAESKRFGVQLQLLKSEQQTVAARTAGEVAQLASERRAVKVQLVATERDLEEARNAYAELDIWRETHHCDSGIGSALDEQRNRFKSQTRELAAQIRYVKAKFTRESTFRNALSVQKRYLLLLVGGMSLDEQTTLKQIASMGYPLPEPARQRRTFKAVGLAVIGTIRARTSAKRWRDEVDLKANAVTAQVGRRRVTSH